MIKKFFLTISFLLLFTFVTNSKVNAASLTFDPNSGDLAISCINRVDLIINTEGAAVNASDVTINYNSTQIEIIDSMTERPGIQIKPGNAFEGYFVNDVDESSGVITLAAGSFSGDLNGSAVFATIEFRNKVGQTNASFSINFTAAGDTYDSNVADSTTSTDLLTSVGNANLTFSPGTCTSVPDETDVTPPDFIFEDPQEYGQVTDNKITFSISDSESGVNIDTLKFTINGQIYTASSPEVSWTGDSKKYFFTITLSEEVANEEIFFTASGMDFATNAFDVYTVYNLKDGVVPGDEGSQVGEDLIDTITIYQDRLEQIFSNTIIGEVIKNIPPNVIVTSVVLLSSLIPFLSFLAAPGLLLNLIGILLGRRNKKPWGLILDSVENKPIAFASCRLYKAETTSLVGQSVSDLEGRYSFILNPGKFRLEVNHSDYEKYVSEIEIDEKNEGYLNDVRLIPKSLAKGANSRFIDLIKDYISKGFEKLLEYLFVIGFLFSVGSFLLQSSTINTIILVGYLLFIILKIISRLIRKQKYGSVNDSNTGYRIPNAIIKIFDPKDYKLLDTSVTNNNGEFDYWGTPGDFGILVTAAGYDFPSKKYTESELIGNNYIQMVKATLGQGKNNIKIFIDPSGSKATNKGNLANPFGK